MRILYVVIALFAVAVVLPQDVPSVEEVRKQVYRAVREVRRYREVWLLTTSEPNFKPITIRRYLDGPRYRQEVQSEGRILFAAGHDGTNGWFVSHENRQFVERKEANRRFDAPYELGPVPEIGSFSLGFVSPYDLDFRCNPNWQVERFVEAKVDGKPVRRLDATSKKSAQSFNHIQIHMDQEGWLLTRVVISGKRETGQRFWQEMQLIDREFGAKMFGDLFKLDAARVLGYERLEKNPMDDGKL